MTLTFGACAPPLRLQIPKLLEEAKLRVRPDVEELLSSFVESWSGQAHAIVVLYIAGVLTDSEVDDIRKRLVKNIDTALLRMTESTEQEDQ
ncbi:MAG: hypothetical protein A4E63_01208 [Syntrophorhabdus sp. PtaU1.Bin050]|nr:MAG: hypothetical protein A4E63_01208 [Syntrophorhabdus sp. PtaU1.Bin050]